MEETRPTRRWFRFSLRTMLVLVTLVCVYLGWAMNWIRQRHAFFVRRGVFDVTIHGPINDALMAIRILGESGQSNIVVDESDVQEARRLFPESTIYVNREDQLVRPD